MNCKKIKHSAIALFSASAALLAGGEICLEPSIIDMPSASFRSPDAPNGFRKPSFAGKGEISTGGKDVAITRSIVHFDLPRWLERI